MKATETDIIRHALGIDRAKKSYRNYFMAGPDHEDYPVLERLVSEGKMSRTRYHLDEINETYIYIVTMEERMKYGCK